MEVVLRNGGRGQNVGEGRSGVFKMEGCRIVANIPKRIGLSFLELLRGAMLTRIVPKP